MRHYKPSSISQHLAAGAVSLVATAGLIALLALPSGEVLASGSPSNAGAMSAMSVISSTGRTAPAQGSTPAAAPRLQAQAPVLQLPRVVIRASRSTVQAKHTPGNAVAQART